MQLKPAAFQSLNSIQLTFLIYSEMSSIFSIDFHDFSFNTFQRAKRSHNETGLDALVTQKQVHPQSQSWKQ